MNFTSPEFLIFFPAVLLLYYVIPQRARWILLLLMSWIFYLSWNPWTGILLILATGCSYAAGIRIEEAGKAGTSAAVVRFWSIIGIGIPLVCLLVFKYAGFFANTTSGLLGQIGIRTEISLPKFVLPIGISFYTFQTLSYVIDVRRGTIPAERHFGIYALFVSFFPQLVAGPIERPGNLIPQLRKVCGMGQPVREVTTGSGNRKAIIDHEDLTTGFDRILTGFFKKLVAADFLASFVDPVYADPKGSTPFAVILAAVFFAIQIYCDFSGYSDIACGAARMMGIRLMENFRLPYLAGSIREFWRRWHISLSTWLMDYIYIPLGGNRRGKARQLTNVMIVFILSGLWHGADLTFLVWGILHGAAICLEILLEERQDNSGHHPVRRTLRWIAALAYICFTWIFFRAETLQDAGILIGRLFSWPTAGAFAETASLMGLTAGGVIHIVLALICLGLLERRAVNTGPVKGVLDKMSEIREARALYVVIMVMTIAASWLMLLADHAGNVFIYFQF